MKVGGSANIGKMAGSIVKRVRSLLSTPTCLVSHTWNRPMSSFAVYCHNDKVQFCSPKRVSILARPLVTVSAWSDRNHVLRPWSRILHTTSWTSGLEEFFPTDGNTIEAAEKTGELVQNLMLPFGTLMYKWPVLVYKRFCSANPFPLRLCKRVSFWLCFSKSNCVVYEENL